MKSRRFDNAPRWWFLTEGGFKKFKDDRIAQGYEVLSRHQDFPHLITTKNKGEIDITWEQANKHLTRKSWKQLNKSARAAFFFKYKREIQRLGLIDIAWLGPRAITFNCTDSVPTIFAAGSLLAKMGWYIQKCAERTRQNESFPRVDRFLD